MPEVHIYRFHLIIELTGSNMSQTRASEPSEALLETQKVRTGIHGAGLSVTMRQEDRALPRLSRHGGLTSH